MSRCLKCFDGFGLINGQSCVKCMAGCRICRDYASCESCQFEFDMVVESGRKVCRAETAWRDGAVVFILVFFVICCPVLICCVCMCGFGLHENRGAQGDNQYQPLQQASPNPAIGQFNPYPQPQNYPAAPGWPEQPRMDFIQLQQQEPAQPQHQNYPSPPPAANSVNGQQY